MLRYYILRAPLPYRVLLVTTLPYLDQPVNSYVVYVNAELIANPHHDIRRKNYHARTKSKLIEFTTKWYTPFA